MAISAAVAVAIALLAVAGGAAEVALPLDITPVEVERVQQAWADTLVKLCRSYAAEPQSARAREEAVALADNLYGFDHREVFFRPHNAAAKPLRVTKMGVISWLVGGSEEFTEDVGFARHGWTKVRFENAAFSLVDGAAMAMGNYYFTGAPGSNETKLEYTFAYFRDPGGQLRINLHFSSVPYQGGANETADPQAISQAQVEAAQKAFGQSIVEIGEYRRREWHFHERANMFVDTLFAYDLGAVLFKPAEATTKPFRTTREGAIAYFRGGVPAFPEDQGFALRPWARVTFRNEEVILHGTQAWAVGIYTCEDQSGWRTEVAYSFGYVRDAKGALRINLLHESFLRDAPSWSGSRDGEMGNVTEEAFEALQRSWSTGVVQVGTMQTMGGDARGRATELVDSVYAYSVRPVLFKPAEAKQKQFRLTRDGAIAYFVAGDPRYPEDTGFALKHWKVVRFHNAGLIVASRQAVAVGRAFATGADGARQRWDYAMGAILDREGVLRINLHHAAVAVPVTARAAAPSSAPVTEEQVAEVQRLWGFGVVTIGASAKNVTRARAVAKMMVDQLYGYSEGPVLFRPLYGTAESRFRLSRAGAVSYFAGGDPDYPEDQGFAMRPWTKVTFENSGGIAFQGNRAQAMGSCYLADALGNEVRLEYTVGYFRDIDGRLRIDLHHMSPPYSAVNVTGGGWDGLVARAQGAERYAEGFFSSASQTLKGALTGRWLGPAVAVAAALLLVGYFVLFWGPHSLRANSDNVLWKDDSDLLLGPATWSGYQPELPELQPQGPVLSGYNGYGPVPTAPFHGGSYLEVNPAPRAVSRAAGSLRPPHSGVPLPTTRPSDGTIRRLMAAH